MKKSLALLAVLLVLAVAVVVGSHAAMTKRQNEIDISQTALLGDPAAAEGLEIQITSNYDRHLYWETTYAAEEKPNPNTTFEFYVNQKKNDRKFQESLDFHTTSLNFGMSGSDIDLQEREDDEDRYNEALMLRPAMAVAARTEPGETKTEVLPLHEYYEFFRMRCSTRLYGSILRNYDWQSAMEKYFRFPVPKDITVSVTVTKDEAGRITDVDMNETEGKHNYYAYAKSVIAEDTFYFIMVTGEEDGLDLSLLPEYGIWSLEMDRKLENGLTAVDYTGPSLVYELDRAQCATEHLAISSDGEELYLVTRESGLRFLTVLDRETMMEKHRTELSCEEIPDIWQMEDLLVLQYSIAAEDESQPVLQVLERAGEKLTAWKPMALYPYTNGYWHEESVLAYDGERLAVAAFHDQWLRGSLRLAVYTKDGVAYVGDYLYSADDIARHLGVNDSHGLRIKWN